MAGTNLGYNGNSAVSGSDSEGQIVGVVVLHILADPKHDRAAYIC